MKSRVIKYWKYIDVLLVNWRWVEPHSYKSIDTVYMLWIITLWEYLFQLWLNHASNTKTTSKTDRFIDTSKRTKVIFADEYWMR